MHQSHMHGRKTTCEGEHAHAILSTSVTRRSSDSKRFTHQRVHDVVCLGAKKQRRRRSYSHALSPWLLVQGEVEMKQYDNQLTLWSKAAQTGLVRCANQVFAQLMLEPVKRTMRNSTCLKVVLAIPWALSGKENNENVR